MNFQDISSQLAPLNIASLVEDKLLPPRYPFASIFSKHVFKDKAPDVTKVPEGELFDFKAREIIINNDKASTAKRIAGSLKLFFWADYPSKRAGYPRYFFVWISPSLDDLIKKDPKSEIPVVTFFHPVGEIGKNEDKYYRDNGVMDTYYRDVGLKYLIDEHFLLFQARYSVGNDSELEKASAGKAICLVLPVFSGTAHASFPDYDSIHYMEILEGLIDNAIPQFYSISERSKMKFKLKRVAVSAYSLGGQLLKRLFSDPRSEGVKKINEVYGYDLILAVKKDVKKRDDESDEEFKNRQDEASRDFKKGKYDSYNEFWRNLKIWQGDDATRLIRLYSAETFTVSAVVAELKSRLKQYGGGKFIEAKFRNYNSGKTEAVYHFEENALEIHSTDDSRIMVLLPVSVFKSYYGVGNPKGVGLWEGHSWFLNALMTHSLCGSMF